MVDFGPDEPEKQAKPLSGRRLKAHKEHKKRNKPGTFGEPLPPPLRMACDAEHAAAVARMHARIQAHLEPIPLLGSGKAQHPPGS